MLAKLDPVLARAICIVVGIGGAIVSEKFLKGSDFYAMALMACGSLFGLAGKGPGFVDATELERLARSTPPTPVPPPPPLGRR